MTTKSIKNLIFCVMVFLSEQALSAASSFEVSIGFEYKNLPLKMQVYELRDGSLDAVTRTRVTRSESQVPVGKEIKGALVLQPGRARTFVLVMRNTTDKEFHFFATPHIPSPPEASIGYLFECLCNSHVFKIASKSIWHRVVRLELNENFTTPKSSLKHTLVGVPADEVGVKYKKVIFNEN